MTTYEKISTGISIISLIILIVGVILTIRQLGKVTEQLNQNSQIHYQNHKWNRMIASQQALFDFNALNETHKLITEFNFFNLKEPIPLDVILSKFKEKPELQNLLHKLLNLYEGFSRGVHHGIYEESIIKNARKGVMKSIFNSFKNYIEHRRNTNQNRGTWSEFESIVHKWEYEDSKKEIENNTGKV